jgi:hypothetical protein
LCFAWNRVGNHSRKRYFGLEIKNVEKENYKRLESSPQLEAAKYFCLYLEDVEFPRFAAS